MMELGTNFLISLWFWWCNAASGVPLWDPFGAALSVMAMLALIGMAIKRIMGED